MIGLLSIPLFFGISFLNFEDLSIKGSLFFYVIWSFYFFVSLCFIFFKKKLSKNLKDFFLFNIYFCIFLIFSVFIGFMTSNFEEDKTNLVLRIDGKIAFLYFGLSLIVTPIYRFILKFKQINNDKFILARKVLGILTFLFALKHGLDYFLIEKKYYDLYHSGDGIFIFYSLKNILNRFDAISGLVSLCIMFFLGITSNIFSYKFLGKFWKSLHILAYPLFILSSIHIALSGRFEGFYVFIFGIVVFLRFLDLLGLFSQEKTKNEKTTKYICVVCSYIYDENIGDIDGGIAPGTKFEDIPDNRVCPLCGVGKKDFEPYYENSSNNTNSNSQSGIISKITYLTKNVIEFKVKTNLKEFKIGQFMTFILKDFDGEFKRSYSIADKTGDEFTFLIKLKSDGRAGKTIKNLKEGEEIKILGIFGDFVLQNTSNPKVFIATGTGLAPIYAMIVKENENKGNKLFFGVQEKQDLFYLEELEKFKNLEKNYYLSKEKIDGFNFGRIDLTKIDFLENTEFYICGSPGLVAENTQFLKEKGFKNVFSEKFL